jgi:hypothetical protein
MASSTTNAPTRPDRRRISTGPQAVALLHEAQAGNSDAFAELFLLTELPSAAAPRRPSYRR